MERIGQRKLYAKGGITKWYWDCRDRAVLRHAARAGSVLDIGCGEGITLEKIVKQNGKNAVALGVEPNVGNIVACRDLPVVRGDVYYLPTLPWDCCLLLDVIEHLSDPGRALREIHHVLAPKGKLVIMFPNDRLFFFARIAFLKFKAAFADYGHLWKFKPSTMSGILEEAGFSIQSVEKLPCKWFPLHTLIVARKT